MFRPNYGTSVLHSVGDANMRLSAIMCVLDEGEVDEATMNMMKVPRCGVPDLLGNQGSVAKRRRRYALQGKQTMCYMLQICLC